MYNDSILTIDTHAVISNYRLLSSYHHGSVCGAVVKADCYGLGMETIAPLLAQAGCKLFFVANIDEAIALRTLVHRGDIVVFHGMRDEQARYFDQYRLTAVLNHISDIHYWIEAKKRHENLPDPVLHIDTGMNRLGLSSDQLANLDMNGLSLKFIMSHLACADEPSHPLNAIQRNQFAQISQHFPGIPTSFANSAAILLPADYHFDIARPGCALYGINPQPKHEHPFSPVVSLHSQVINTRELKQAETIGYGATQSLPAGSRIATIPIGYADGIFRHLAKKGNCFVHSQRVPIIGAISMDLITIDVTHVTPQVTIGDQIELLGPHQSVNELAKVSGTIGYEICTSLGQRYQRVYL